MKYLVFVSLFALACTSAPKSGPVATVEPAVVLQPECISKRAAFDIGSGETRLNVSKVDICNHKIIATELELKQAIPYKDEMVKSRSPYLKPAIMQAGFKVLQDMKREAEKFSPDAYIGVATAVFREARNGQTYINEVNKSLRINARVISQEEEAGIAYYAALTTVKVPKQNLVVWDIGGSSQQIIYKKGEDDFSIYEGKLASVSFKNKVIQKIKKSKAASPNPLSAEQMTASIQLAATHAVNDVPEDIKTVFSKPNTQVIGVGGVHYYSILQPKKEEGSHLITKKDIDDLVKEVTSKSDADFSGKYPDTRVTNVALVDGFMQALNIKAIEIHNVNLSHGLLVHPTLWKP